MYKLIRIFNQNRKKIVVIILIIVFAFALLQILNYFAKNNNGVNFNSGTSSSSNLNSKYYLANNSSIISDKSVISGESLSETEINSETRIIEKFLNYCNNGDVDNAYGMLTDDCKSVMFPTIEDFYNIYYLKIFDSYKTYTIENYIGNIYSVRINEDILSTGKLNNNSTKHDYITIVKNDGENKLNINNYIKRNTRNKKTSYKNINIIVNTIDIYMDYEVYNLTIENNSKNSIMLDHGDDTKSIYLLDNNNMKYYFYTNEILDKDLQIESGYKKNISIKSMASYSSTRTIERLVFSKMSLNNEENEDYYIFNVDL